MKTSRFINVSVRELRQGAIIRRALCTHRSFYLARLHDSRDLYWRQRPLRSTQYGDRFGVSKSWTKVQIHMFIEESSLPKYWNYTVYKYAQFYDSDIKISGNELQKWALQLDGGVSDFLAPEDSFSNPFLLKEISDLDNGLFAYQTTRRSLFPKIRSRS